MKSLRQLMVESLNAKTKKTDEALSAGDKVEMNGVFYTVQSEDDEGNVSLLDPDGNTLTLGAEEAADLEVVTSVEEMSARRARRVIESINKAKKKKSKIKEEMEDEVDDLETELKEKKKVMKEADGDDEEAEKEVAKLEEKLKTAKKKLEAYDEEDDDIDELEEAMKKKIKEEEEETEDDVEKLEEELDELETELEEKKKTVKESDDEEEIKNVKEECDELEDEITEKKKAIRAVKRKQSVHESLNDDWSLEHEYGVFRTGGSIGSPGPDVVTARFGRDLGILVYTAADNESAKDLANKARKLLSPGERKYYGMSYKVKPLDDKLKQQMSAVKKK